MSYNRFRINSTGPVNTSAVPAAEPVQVSSRRFRLSQAAPAPVVVDMSPASPVSSDIPMPGARRSLSILIEDSDSSSSITSPSLDSNHEASSPVHSNTSSPIVQLDRSIPTRRTLLDTEVNFPVYSTIRTSRLPELSVVQANVVDYDTACRYNINNILICL